MNCIYCYTNPENGRRYIGQTTNERQRFLAHLFYASHPDNEFHRDMCRIGFDKFKYEILEVIEDQLDIDSLDKKLNEAEKRFIALYRSNNPLYGYNKDSGGGYKRNKIPLWKRMMIKC